MNDYTTPMDFFLQVASSVLFQIGCNSYKLASLKLDKSQGKWQVYGDFKKNLVFGKVVFSTFCSDFLLKKNFLVVHFWSCGPMHTLI